MVVSRIRKAQAIYPALAMETRVALTLRMVVGLTGPDDSR
jgi:hypothetical protein